MQHQYEFKKEVWKVFDFELDDFTDNRTSSRWREFYEGIDDIAGLPVVPEDKKLVTKYCRATPKAASIYARHNRAKGYEWCPTKFNLSLKKPIAKDAAEFVFKLSIVNGNGCNCGEYF